MRRGPTCPLPQSSTRAPSERCVAHLVHQELQRQRQKQQQQQFQQHPWLFNRYRYSHMLVFVCFTGAHRVSARMASPSSFDGPRDFPLSRCPSGLDVTITIFWPDALFEMPPGASLLAFYLLIFIHRASLGVGVSIRGDCIECPW
jgi:hypothetical protein